MATATKDKSAKTKTTAKVTPLVLQGMGEVEIGAVQYINVDDAIKTFNYLWQYDKSMYVRTKKELTKEEHVIYKTILTVPKSDTTFYIRNLTPFLIWKSPNGKHYIINGNSRFQAMTKIRKDDKSIEFADIAFQIIEGELKKELIESFQFNLNDTTRKNPAIETLKRINATLQEAIKGGMEPPRAREYVCNYYGKSQQTISNAIKLCEKDIPQLLEDLLDSDNATTEGCVKCIQASEALNLSPETVAGMVLAHAKKAKLTENNVKNWRKDYESELARIEEEARLKKEAEACEKEESKKIQEQRDTQDAIQSIIGEDTIIDEINDFSDDANLEEENKPQEKEKIDIVSLIDKTRPEQLGTMFRIAASLLSSQELNEDVQKEVHESIKSLLVALSSAISESDAEKIQNALR